MSFFSDAEGVASRILGGSGAGGGITAKVNQPLAKTPNPFPDNTVPDGAEDNVLTRVPGPYNPTQGGVCVPRGQMMQRMQMRIYNGPGAAIPNPIGSLGNWAYVFSDPVPNGKYWIIHKASLFQTFSSGGTNAGLLLFMTNQGPQNAALINAGPYAAVKPFTTAGASPTNANTWPVTGNTMRVDEFLMSDVDGSGPVSPFEVMMVRTKNLFVPQGYSLVGSNLQTDGPEDAFLTLKLLLAEMSLNEYTEDSL